MRKNRDHFVTSDSCDYDNNSNDDAGDVCKTLSSATSDNCVVGHQVAQQQCIMITMMMMMINKVVIITWKMEDGGDGEQDGGDDHDHKDDDGGQQDVGIDDDNAEQGGLGGRGCIILAWQLFGPLATQGFAKIEEQKIKTSI